MRYPVLIEKIDGEYIASISHPNGKFQGVCEGKTRAEVKQAAEKLLVAIIFSALKDGDEIPAPSTCNAGNAYISLPIKKAANSIGIGYQAQASC